MRGATYKNSKKNNCNSQDTLLYQDHYCLYKPILNNFFTEGNVMDRKLVQIFIAVAALLLAAAPLCAKPWGIVATQPDYFGNGDNESIHTIDLGQTPPVVYGPFLSGQLTSGEGPGVFDIALFKNGKRALISTFGDSRVHLVDLKDPTNPVLLGSLDLPFFAEDIAITRDSRTALVTDGGFAPYVAFIDLKTFTLSNVVEFDGLYANAVEIAGNKIAIFADYFQGLIFYGKINKTRDGFEYLRSVVLCDDGQYDNATDCMGEPGRPVNVTASPNGRTVLAAIASGGMISAFELTKNGDLIPGDPFMLTGLPGGNQSIAFQNNSTAYVTVQRQPLEGPGAVMVNGQVGTPDVEPGQLPNQLCQINILGPGRTQYVTARYTLLNYSTSQLFGVDTLAIQGKNALVSNSSLSVGDPLNYPYFNSVASIDLNTGILTPIELNNYGVAAGVAITR
jgi:hypothetical protein